MKELELLAKDRWRIALILTALMILIYFGFILLVAFNKPLMSTLLSPGLSFGILLGVGVIVSAWALTVTYVIWANQSYDARVATLKSKVPVGELPL